MRVRVFANLFFVLLFSLTSVFAADNASVRGAVVDPLGGAIGGATVELRRDGVIVKASVTDGEGRFTIDGLAEGRYRLLTSAPGFEPRDIETILRAGVRTSADVILQIGAVRQDIVVTATAGAVSSAQVGASVTVLDASLLESLGSTELLEPLRSVPGVAVVQTGQRGGITSLFIRGGSSNFNKILIDGMPANDIGGAFDFASLTTTGVERVEVLRGANSVIYGSDAMTGVVDITTRQGRTRLPEGVASIDAGNLSTAHTDLSLGGTARALNYFLSYSHLQTDNNLPNDKYRTNTIAARAGVRFGNTDLSGTFRRGDGHAGLPNAYSYYGIADDSSVATTATYGTVTAQSQINDRWQSTIRFGVSNQSYDTANPTPTGTPSDDSAFANYLGHVVTIHGANGYSVIGQGILDYCCAFPSLYAATTDRSLLQGQTSYQLLSSLNVSGGVRVEHEHGVADSGTATETTRNNYGGFVEGRGSIGSRIFVTAGAGFDHNAVFGYATTPRVSVAGYLRPPTSASMWGDTKATFNAGTGIKAPNLSQELSSVFALLPASTASSFGVDAIGPERSRTLDVGLEQGLAHGHARVRASYFRSEFSDLIEYIEKSVLPQLGVSQAVADALSFGAYTNAQSNRSSGVEMSADVVAGDFKVTGSYTYLDAVVTKSLSSGVLFPMINPAFPGMQIGQYSPLVGARPFRRPANSGSLVITYARSRAQLSLASYFFGKADDSTFLSDAFFGASMLLPNKNLDAAYQTFDVNGSYRIHPRLRWYVTAENVFNETYEASAGYPALPRVVRTGVTVTLGGH
jgi:iron complex outermembrane receptor protein/vitamin B12 transporter